MKNLKIIIDTLIISISITSCTTVVNDDAYYDDPYYVNLEQVVNAYDLWYIDYNRTEGKGDVAFLSKAFISSFHTTMAPTVACPIICELS